MKAASFLRRLILLPYQLFVLIVFFALLPLCSLGILFAGLFDGSGDRAHLCLTYWARVNLALAGLRVRIEGLQRLEPRGTYVFMPNHASFLDILLVLACIPYNFRMITKEEMFRIPFIGWILRKSGQIPMNRTHPRQGLKSLRRASHLVREAISIVVFPEGTRTSNGGINEFKATLFILPIRSGVPVVPVLVEGTFSALKRGSILLNPVPLKLTFHNPISPGAFKEDERWLYAKQVREVLVCGARANSNLEAR